MQSLREEKSGKLPKIEYSLFIFGVWTRHFQGLNLLLDVHLWRWNNSGFGINVTSSMYNFMIFYSISTPLTCILRIFFFVSGHFVRFLPKKERRKMPSRFFFSTVHPRFFCISIFYECLVLSNLSTAYLRIKIDPLKTI